MQVKRSICKYFLQGRCEKGNLCTWAHGEQELNAPAGSTNKLLQEQAVEPSEEVIRNVKRTICTFWQQGRCRSGDECLYAHGEHELGQPYEEQKRRPGLNQPLAEAPSTASPLDGNATVVYVPVVIRADVAEKLGATKGSFASVAEVDPLAVKRSLCKYWQNGNCDRGALCTWAHGEHEIGMPALTLSQGAALDGSDVPSETGVEPPEETIQYSPSKPTAVGEVKRTICKFWLENACERGNSCLFAHGRSELGTLASVELPAAAPRSSAFRREDTSAAVSGRRPTSAYVDEVRSQASPTKVDDALVRRTICKFWQEGTCDKTAGNCSWAHGEREIGTLAPREYKRPCKFYKLGTCTKGDVCPFAHLEEQDDVDSEDVDVPPKRRRFF